MALLTSCKEEEEIRQSEEDEVLVNTILETID